MSPAEAYIAGQDPETSRIMSELRSIIMRSSPALTEGIKYGIPFYTYIRPLCYLNPTRGGVNLGLARGAELSNGNGLLSGEGKQVRHVFIAHGADVPERAVTETLYEAMALNELPMR